MLLDLVACMTGDADDDLILFLVCHGKFSCSLAVWIDSSGFRAARGSIALN